MLAGDGVIGVLEGAEQQRNVLALTDAFIHPAGVFNPNVHNANHHIGSQRVVHGQKEPAGGGGILLVKAAHGLAGGMGLVHHPAQRQNGCGRYFCFKHHQFALDQAMALQAHFVSALASVQWSVSTYTLNKSSVSFDYRKPNRPIIFRPGIKWVGRGGLVSANRPVCVYLLSPFCVTMILSYRKGCWP